MQRRHGRRDDTALLELVAEAVAVGVAVRRMPTDRPALELAARVDDVDTVTRWKRRQAGIARQAAEGGSAARDDAVAAALVAPTVAEPRLRIAIGQRARACRQTSAFAEDARTRRGWIGEAGPGPSYLDPGSGGPENEFTQRNTTFMTWNLMHLALMLRDAGGIPAHGNQRSLRDAGCRWDQPNPEHR